MCWYFAPSVCVAVDGISFIEVTVQQKLKVVSIAIGHLGFKNFGIVVKIDDLLVQATHT